MQTIVRVFPGFLMVFNTAIEFVAAGVAPAVGALAPEPRRAVHAGVGIGLVVLGALVVAQ